MVYSKELPASTCIFLLQGSVKKQTHPAERSGAIHVHVSPLLGRAHHTGLLKPATNTRFPKKQTTIDKALEPLSCFTGNMR